MVIIGINFTLLLPSTCFGSIYSSIGTGDRLKVKVKVTLEEATNAQRGGVEV